MKKLSLLVLSVSSSLILADSSMPAPQNPTPQIGEGLLPIRNGDQIIHDFRTKYAGANKPRLLIYINRDLITQRGEMMEVVNTSHSTQVKGDVVNSNAGVNVQLGNNTNASGNFSVSPVVTGQGGEKLDQGSVSVRVIQDADKGVEPINDYEARQIEETFTDKFYQGGAHFIDQKIASALQKTFSFAGDRFLTAPSTNNEKDEVEGVKKNADVVIEILARRKSILLPTPAGDEVHEQLDLTATAFDVRQPGLVLARVSSNSLFGFNKQDGAIRVQQAARLTDDDFIDQVSLALMDRISF